MERVRVTDPDGEPENGCVKDLRGLYGCLIISQNKAKIKSRTVYYQNRHSRNISAQHFLDHLDFDEEINRCGARIRIVEFTASTVFAFGSHL